MNFSAILTQNQEIWIGAALVFVIVLFFIYFKSSAQAPKTPDPSRQSKETPRAAARAPRFSKALQAWIPLLHSKTKDKKQWEEVLIRSDLGPRLTDHLLKSIPDDREMGEYLRAELKTLIADAEWKGQPWKEQKPYVIFVIGVNGVGKTTSIGKLANYFKNTEKLKVGIVAADTFRKAAIEQLETWSARAEVDFFACGEPTEFRRGRTRLR